MLKYSTLIGIVILGIVIRFWNLDTKPLWLDEIPTALFSLGHTYAITEKQPFLNISTLDQMFACQPATFTQINQTLINQDNHPPLFFYMMHWWLGQLWSLPQSFVWKLRSLPSLFGGISIILVYCLNRLAFNHRSGLMAAIFMAVSPFGIYLAQEARQYSFAVCLILFVLICIIKIQKDIASNHLTLIKSMIWVAWVVFNGVGFYVHYFFLYAFLAQILTLSELFYRQRKNIPRENWIVFAIAVSAVTLIYSFGISVVLTQSSGDRTDWLNFDGDYLGPILRNLAGVITMLILLPVEDQPIWIVISSAILMITYSIFLGHWTFLKIKRLLKRYPTTFTLLSFTSWAFLINLATPYLLHKDISVAFRYNFTYFSGVCVLIGVVISSPISWKLDRKLQIVLLAGLFSSILTITNFSFVKPYYPEQVAAKILRGGTDIPMVIRFAYVDVLDIAKGLSYGLEVHRRSNRSSINISFVNQKSRNLQQDLAHIREKFPTSFNLWLVDNLQSKNIKPQDQLLITNICKAENKRDFQSFGLLFQSYHC